MIEKPLDAFICIHDRDIGYLLETVLRSYGANFCSKNQLFLISNDPVAVRTFLEKTGICPNAIVSSDADWLSKNEMELPGWFRQQIIKLRAFEFCETENFCNLGADTILLQPIEYSDLVDGQFPVLYYTRHIFPNSHRRYERERIQHIGRILQVEPNTALSYVDFINDLFCFNHDALMRLNTYLKTLYGDEPYVKLLRGLPDHSSNRNKFGEWTLYSTYLLDVLKLHITPKNTRPDFLYQVHSQLNLFFYPFNTKVVHFVGKDFDVEIIKRHIANHHLELRHHL